MRVADCHDPVQNCSASAVKAPLAREIMVGIDDYLGNAGFCAPNVSPKLTDRAK